MANVDTAVRFGTVKVRVLAEYVPLFEKLISDFEAFGFVGVFEDIQVIFAPPGNFRSVFLLV
jgi:hypothetical protein